MEAYETKFGNLTILNCKCRMCNKDYALKVKTEDHTDYVSNGKLIQLAFPYLSAGERELIISGICDTCFTDMFKDDEEDEEHQDDADELLGMIYSKTNKD